MSDAENADQDDYRPGWAQPALVLRRTGSGFDTEARIVTPDHESAKPADDWPPIFTTSGSPATWGQPHSGMPPSPRR